jgi:hypothetical protein
MKSRGVTVAPPPVNVPRVPPGAAMASAPFQT